MRIVLLLGVLLWAVSVWAEPKALKSWDFEQGVEAWMTADKQAQLQQCKEAEHVNSGEGSLQFSYRQRVPAEDIPGAVFVGTEGGITGAKALQFALKSSVGGPLIAVLREADDSTYVYLFYLPADQWQVLDLPLADFHLEDQSQDENGKLDLDQVGGFGFVDPMTWFLQAEGQAQLKIFAFPPATRRDLWLDDVKLMDEAAGQKTAQAPGGAEAVMIEDCDSDPGYWTILGGLKVQVKADDEQAASGAALRVDYELPQGTLIVFGRQLAAGSLAGFRGLVFSTRSGRDCKLAVSVEETTKARYSTIVELPQGNWRQLTVPLRDLKLDDDSRDPDGALQPEKIRTVQFADVSTLIEQKEIANTLWLDEVMAIK